MSSTADSLAQLFDAERNARRLHDAIADAKDPGTLEVLASAITAAQKEDEEEASLRLVRVAQLLGELEGPKAVDLLIDVLSSEHGEARAAAGEQLEGIAFERFKEVASGVERALDRLPEGSPALPELPYLFAEVPEPGVFKLLERFLKHADADAVAAAIEVSVEMGDPSMVKHLEKLKDDARKVDLDDGGRAEEISIGDLALDAIGILNDLEDDA